MTPIFCAPFCPIWRTINLIDTEKVQLSPFQSSHLNALSFVLLQVRASLPRRDPALGARLLARADPGSGRVRGQDRAGFGRGQGGLRCSRGQDSSGEGEDSAMFSCGSMNAFFFNHFETRRLVCRPFNSLLSPKTSTNAFE